MGPYYYIDVQNGLKIYISEEEFIEMQQSGDARVDFIQVLEIIIYYYIENNMKIYITKREYQEMKA